MTPSPKPRKAADLRSIQIPEGMDVEGDIRIKPAESNPERNHRLWKERWSFLINDLLASIVAFAILIALVVFSFVMLVRASSTPDDRRFATSLLAAVGTAVAGFGFGRGTK